MSALALLALLLGSPAMCNEEDLARVESVSQVVSLPKPYGRTTVELTAEGRASARWAGGKALVSAGKLCQPRVETLQVTHGPGFDGKLGVYLRFACADGTKAALELKDGRFTGVGLTAADGTYSLKKL